MSFWIELFLVAGFGLAFMAWCLVRASAEPFDEEENIQEYIRELDKYNMRNRGL